MGPTRDELNFHRSAWTTNILLFSSLLDINSWTVGKIWSGLSVLKGCPLEMLRPSMGWE